MRNALVLVPLCIGLTSGFIVSTTTSEVTKNLPMITSESMVNISTDEAKIKSSLQSDDAPLYNINTNEVEKELYSQDTEGDKNINERSYVLVNQRWKKIPYRTNLVDTKTPTLSFLINVSKTSSNSDVSQDIIRNYSKKQQNMEENKRNTIKTYFPPAYQIHNTNFPNHKSYIEHHEKNKDSIKQKNYIEFMKPTLLKSAMKSDKGTQMNRIQSPGYIASNNYLAIYNHTTLAHMKYLNKVADDVNVNDKNKENFNGDSKQNNLLFKDKLYDLQDNVSEDLLWARKLFPFTLEEQAPIKQSLQKYNTTNLHNYKYCQQCTGKVNFGKLNRDLDIQCKCKCGRYIHLKGSSELKDHLTESWEAFVKAAKST